ncbi:MAG TPA: hypothetical protein VNE62_13030 [Actinomycetota bacterium]|nr:hypothetical protein [Actinomycetota bacterium]
MEERQGLRDAAAEGRLQNEREGAPAEVDERGRPRVTCPECGVSFTPGTSVDEGVGGRPASDDRTTGAEQSSL